MPGIEFVVDARGRKTAALVNLKKHGPLLEDLIDAYLFHARRHEPRESLAQVKRLIKKRAKR